MTRLEGVVMTPLKVISVPGGDVFHGIKATESTFRGFGEAYFSTIEPNAIKPWKRHNRMSLNLVVIVGSIRFVVYDDREKSQTFGLTSEHTIGPEANYCRLTVSPGLWVAFEGKSDRTSILLNVSDILHDPEEIDRRELHEIYFQWRTK